jgi:lipoate---protein ligase
VAPLPRRRGARTGRADRLISPSWRVEGRTGPAGELHATWPSVDSDPGSRAVAVCEPEGPCVVLGSTQPEEQADPVRAGDRGVALTRRRTGGGAVLVDVVDPVWIASPDLGRSFDWLGETWVRALDALGLRGLSSRRGGVVRTEWSGLVCFAGWGRGEVFDADGRKVVGLAQRRTRFGSWFQSACVVRSDPSLLLDTLSLSGPERARARRELAAVATGVGDLGGAALSGVAGHAAVTAALLESLP